jgi:hypothetical protein
MKSCSPLASNQFYSKDHPRHVVISPRTEREDPFSMQGFFPGPSRDEWKWLKEDGYRSEDDRIAVAVAAEDTVVTQLPVTDGDLKEILKEEDKFGLLGMGKRSTTRY